MLPISRKLVNNISQFLVNSNKTALTTNSSRYFSINSVKYCAATEASESNENPAQALKDEKAKSLDRTKVIPVETSIKYMNSSAYKETYGEHLVWQQYRRNHKGIFPPKHTRKTCTRKGVIATGNPCPICRDEYLVLDHRNIDLLKQFISKQSGEVLSYSKTGLCQKKHLELLVAVERAMDHGLLTFDVPFRQFDYSEYYSKSN